MNMYIDSNCSTAQEKHLLGLGLELLLVDKAALAE
jgi:hypothetical protein